MVIDLIAIEIQMPIRVNVILDVSPIFEGE